MNTKTTAVLATCLSLSSFLATAKITQVVDNDLSHLRVGFKIAVIEDAPGSNEIYNGDYSQSIKTSNAMIAKGEEVFATSMSLCVANMKVGAFETADLACTSAIKAINNIKERPNSMKNVNYLTAVAYSNRGIVHHYLGDKVSAFRDFSMAMSIDDNQIVQENLAALNIATLKQELIASTLSLAK